MTSEGLGEMFEGDSAETYAGTFPLKLMGGRAEGLACAEPGARTPIGMSGTLVILLWCRIYCNMIQYNLCITHLTVLRKLKLCHPNSVIGEQYKKLQLSLSNSLIV